MGSRRRLSCALLILVWSGVFATLVLVPGHPRRSRHDTVTTQGLPCGVAGSDRAQHLGRFASLTSGTSAADRTAREFARLATNDARGLSNVEYIFDSFVSVWVTSTPLRTTVGN